MCYQINKNEKMKLDSSCLKAKDISSRLYELNSNIERMFVVGDLHGDFETFKRIIDAWQKKNNSNILFLGDYADRGYEGVEIVESLMDLSQQERVTVSKGNHEDYSLSGEPEFGGCDFIREVEKKRGDWNSYFNQKLKPFFDKLYVSTIVPNTALFLHGGISSKIKGINDLKNPIKSIEDDILWSDPHKEKGEIGNWERGVGVKFGQDITEVVLQNLGVNFLIRSHEPRLAKDGPYFSHNGKVITISSCRIYGKPHYLEIETSQLPRIKKDTKKLIECVRYVR